MKRLGALALLLALSALPIYADVEKKVQGNWTMIGDNGKPFIFHLLPNGRYYTTCEGMHVESGTMTTGEGKWSLQSDLGRKDNGTFSVTDSGLVLNSALTRTTRWKRFTGTEPTPAATGGAAIPPGSSMPPTSGAQEPSQKNSQTQTNSSGAQKPGGFFPSFGRKKTPGFSSTYGGYNEYRSKNFRWGR